MSRSIRNVCCSLHFLFIILPICFVLCVVLVTVPSLVIQSTHSIDALVLTKLDDVAGKLKASLDGLFARCSLSETLVLMHHDGLVNIKDTDTAFRIYARMLQAWDNLRWLETTNLAGEWNSVEKREGGLRHLLHEPGTHKYDYYEVDPVTLQPIPGTNTPSEDDALKCCGYQAMVHQIQRRNITFEQSAGEVAWTPAEVWDTQYLMSCTRTLFNASNSFVGVATVYFELTDLAEYLKQSITKPSEKIFIVQDGDPPIILSSSDISVPLMAIASDGVHSSVPFAESCVEGAMLASLVGKVTGTQTMELSGHMAYVNFQTYNVDPYHALIIIHVVHTSDYLESIQRQFTVLGGAIAAVCTALVIACAILAHLLTAPLTALLPHLENISSMNLQAVNLDSPITEIHRIYKAFAAMVEQLIEYKAYMPEHLFVKDEDSEDHDHDQTELYRVKNVMASSDLSNVEAVDVVESGSNGESGVQRIAVQSRVMELGPPSTQSSGMQSGSYDSSYGGSDSEDPKARLPHRNSSGSRGDKKTTPGLKGKLSNFASVRVITVLTVDIARFHELAIGWPDHAEALFEKTLDLVSKEVIAMKGTLCRFHGGNFMAVWNAVSRCSSHRRRATEAASSIAKGFPALALVDASIPRLKVGIGITSGEVLCGNMGTTRNRTFNVIGPLINMSAYLAKACALYNVPIIINQLVAQGVLYTNSNVALMDIIPYPRVACPDSLAGHLIYVVDTQADQGVESEWMYELAQQRLTSHAMVSEAFNYFLNGDLRAAQLHLSKVTDSPSVSPAISQIQGRLSALITQATRNEINPKNYVASLPPLFI